MLGYGLRNSLLVAGAGLLLAGAAQAAELSPADACADGASRLCLLGRLEVETAWPDGERSERAATALPASAKSGAFSAGRSVVHVEAGDQRGLAALWSESPGVDGVARLDRPERNGTRVLAYLVSPDGDHVAFTASHRGGRAKLYEAPIVGGTPRRIDDDQYPVSEDPDIEPFAFRADSSALGFVSDQPSDIGLERFLVTVTISTIFADDLELGDFFNWSDMWPVPTCPAPTGGPTLHANSVGPSEIWTANGSPHILTANVTVPAGITLTVLPCADVRIRANVSLTVLGMLINRGTPHQRITFHRDDPSAAFASIWVRSPGFADVAFADVIGGGSSNAPLLLEGVDNPVAFPMSVDHVKVIGAAGHGVLLTRNAAFGSGSRDLAVTGSGQTQVTAPFPIRLELTAVGTIPTGVYRGNASDLIQVIVSSTLATDLAFHDRGVPYQIGGGGSAGLITVAGSSSLASLTIDPGVEMQFSSAGANIGGLFIGSGGSPTPRGRLVAAGTAALPIVLTGTGVAPPPGSWEGVTFSGPVDPGSLLDHVHIVAAGAHGGDQGYGCPPLPSPWFTDGALKVFTQPPSGFLTNSTITDSSSHGVFRAWTGGLVDFLSTNTFQNVQGCNQVLPHPPAPQNCPQVPDCPQ